MAQLMLDSSAIKKYSADKIALLGLLVLSLLFANLITTARFTRPLKAGSQAIARLKSQGLEAILDKQGWEAYFLIKDSKDRLLGFSVETFEHSEGVAERTITGTGHFYLGRPYFQQNLASFNCDDALDSFTLEGRVQALGRQGSTTEVALDKGGNITVKTSDSGQKVTFEAEEVSVPEYLIERLAVEATEGSDKKIVLNVIRNDGTKDVALVSKKRTPGTAPKMGGGARIVEIHYPEQQHTTQVLLDGAGRIVQMVVGVEVIFVYERTTREEIIRLFGERVWGVPEQDALSEPEAK